MFIIRTLLLVGLLFAMTDIIWSEVDDTAGTYIFSLAAFDSYLYAGSGFSGKIDRTSNGTTWAEAEDFTDLVTRSLAVFDSYLYAGTGNNGKIYRTSDGTTWTEAEDTTETGIYSLAVFDSYLYAGASPNGKIYRTSDGTTWTEAEDTTEIDIFSLAVFDSYLYAGTGNNGKIYRTSDGTTWAEVEDTGETAVYSLTVFDGYLYASTAPNGKILRTSDGTTWVEVEELETDVTSSVTFNGRIHIGTGDGDVYSSDDGVSWSLEINTGEVSVYSLAVFDNNIYAGTGGAGRIFRGQSPNQGTLAVTLPSLGVQMNDVLGVQMPFLPVVAMEGTMDNLGSTGTGDIEISSMTVDFSGEQIGENFSCQKEVADFSATETSVRAFGEFNSYLYAVAEPSTKIYRSLEGAYGEDWTEVADLSGSDPVDFTYFDGYFYLTGYSGSTGLIYRTTDGEIWTEVASESGARFLYGQVFGTNIYVGTIDGTIYRSAYGTTWTEVWDSGEAGVREFGLFGAYLYASVGSGGKLYRTLNGTSWTLVNEFTGAGLTYVSSPTEFKGYFYLGVQGSAGEGKVYRSSNGTDWTEVFDSGDTGVSRFVIFDNFLFVASTSSPSPYGGKLWRSYNGLDWTQVGSTSEYYFSATAAFDDFLYTGSRTDAIIKRCGYPYGALSVQIPSFVFDLTDISAVPLLSLEYQVNVDFSLTGVTGTIGQMAVTIPSFVSAFFGDVRMECVTSAASASLTGVSGTVGALDYEISALVFDGSATNISSNMNFTLPSPMIMATGANSSPGDITSSAKAKVSFTGLTGTVGTLNVICPSLIYEARGTPIITGVLHFVCPSLFYSFTASDSIPSTLIGYSICAENKAVTTYSNYGFISLGNLDNIPIGAKSDGLYKLEGSNDDGSDIDAEVLTVLSSLGTNQQKRASDLYLTGDFPKDGMTGSFKVPNKVATIDSALVRSKVSNESYRAKVPRGIVFRRVSFGFKNVDGKDFKVDDLELRTSVTERKVK